MITENANKRKTFNGPGTLSNIVLTAQKSKRVVVTEQKVAAIMNNGFYRSNMYVAGHGHQTHGRKSVIQTTNTSKLAPHPRRLSQDSVVEKKDK